MAASAGAWATPRLKILFLGVDIQGIDWHLVPFSSPNLWTYR
jgi:hypothetical protein